MKKPKTIYANAVNLRGLWSREPVELTWDSTLNCYYDKRGEFSIQPNQVECQFTNDYGYISYASISRHKVGLWTMGAKSVMHLLKQWSRNGYVK